MTDGSISERRVGPLMISESRGAGEADHPIVFLHGIGSSRHAFDDQLRHFGSRADAGSGGASSEGAASSGASSSNEPSAGRWCVAPDAPGYGDSDDVPAIASLDDYVDHVLALLDGIGAARADLVGVSWGGVIAARLAAHHPARVARLVLADTSRGSGVDPDRAELMRGRGDALAAQGAAAFAAARAPRLLSPQAPADLVEAVASEMAAAIRLPGYGQAARAMADTDHGDLLGRIDAPTLVVVGEADVVCPPSEAEVLTAAIPTASLVVIPGAGHLANREQPAAFNQALDDFLTSDAGD